MGKIEISIPSESLFFDFVYIYKQKGTWKSWPDIVRKQEIETGVAIQIPTIDTARYLYILDMFIRVIILLCLDQECRLQNNQIHLYI